MTNLRKIVSFPFLTAIRVYQKTLSPDHGLPRYLHPGGFCRFHPTCSEYSFQAIDRFGPVRGVPLGVWRILRCHPWSKGGHDPVPE